MEQMRFNRLSISQEVLVKYMKKVGEGGKNPAYEHADFPNTIFMQYSEKGENFFTIIGRADYEKIKSEYWSGTNNYVSTCRGGKTVYLHRELCTELHEGQYVHHRGSKFDNRPQKLEAVTPAQHDQHRTYCGDLIVDVR